MADGRAVSIYIREWEPIICMIDTPFSVSLLNRSCREQSEGRSHIAHWYIMEHRHGCPPSGEQLPSRVPFDYTLSPFSALFYFIPLRTRLRCTPSKLPGRLQSGTGRAHAFFFFFFFLFFFPASSTKRGWFDE